MKTLFMQLKTLYLRTTKRQSDDDDDLVGLFHPPQLATVLNSDQGKTILLNYPSIEEILGVHNLPPALVTLDALQESMNGVFDAKVFQQWICVLMANAEALAKQSQKCVQLFEILDHTGAGFVTIQSLKERLQKKVKTIHSLFNVRLVHTVAVGCTDEGNTKLTTTPQLILNILYNQKKEQELFDTFQQDRDGNIELKSFLCGLRIMLQRAVERIEKICLLRELFDALDLDKGGTLTKEEVRESLSQVTAMDANATPTSTAHSIAHSLLQFPTLVSCLHARNFEKSMQTLDVDGDGEITLKEFLHWVDMTERDAKERAKFVPPLELILQLEESSVEGLWRIWKDNFLCFEEHAGEAKETDTNGAIHNVVKVQEKKDGGQLIRLILYKLRRDYTFKNAMKTILPFEVYEGIRTMLIEVLIPKSMSTFRRQKRIQWGKLTLYDFVVAVDCAMVKKKQVDNKVKTRCTLLPNL